jgi:phosphate transport system permease protein
MSAALAPAVAEPRFNPQLARRKLAGTIFLGACLTAVGLLMLALVLLMYEVITKGLPYVDLDFLTSFPSRRAERAGVLPALIGSLEIGLIVGVITFPVGVGAAVYLEEYARDTRLNSCARTSRTSPACPRSSTASSGSPCSSERSASGARRWRPR